MNKFKHYRDKVFHHVQTILTKTLVALVNRWKLCRNHWGIYFIWLCSKAKQNCWTVKLKTIFFSKFFFVWNEKVVLYHAKTSEYPLHESSQNLLKQDPTGLLDPKTILKWLHFWIKMNIMILFDFLDPKGLLYQLYKLGSFS